MRGVKPGCLDRHRMDMPFREGEAPDEPERIRKTRLGRSLALPLDSDSTKVPHSP